VLRGGDGKERERERKKKGEPKKVLHLAEGYMCLSPKTGLLLLFFSLFIASEK
jgi:hypothetical protein